MDLLRFGGSLCRRFDAALARHPPDVHEITDAYCAFVQAEPPPSLRQAHPPAEYLDLTAEEVYRRLTLGLPT